MKSLKNIFILLAAALITSCSDEEIVPNSGSIQSYILGDVSFTEVLTNQRVTNPDVFSVSAASIDPVTDFPSWTILKDTVGNFKLGPFQPGTYVVSGTYQDTKTGITYEATQGDVTIIDTTKAKHVHLSLEPVYDNTFVVSIVDSFGIPVANASIWLYQNLELLKKFKGNSEIADQNGKSNSAGRALFYKLPGGSYYVYAEKQLDSIDSVQYELTSFDPDKPDPASTQILGSSLNQSTHTLYLRQK